MLGLGLDWLSAGSVERGVAWYWLACAELLALGASFRGLENALRFRGDAFRVGLGVIGLCFGVWAGLAAAFGELSGVAFIGLCLVGTCESVLAKGLEQGGSDPMTLWMRALVAGAVYVGEAGLGLLNAVGGGLLLASYWCAGWSKVRTRDWWNGRALQAYLARPTYDVCMPVISVVPSFGYRCMGLAVLAFELFAPAVLLSRGLLWVWVVVGVGFHAANVLLFGLHRFFWTWIAAYPLLFGL